MRPVLNLKLSMNKVYNINLGGYPFVIDHDAFDELEKYLSSLNNYFKVSEGRDEIVADIEARIGELFKEKLKRRKIVSFKDVNEVIDTMGRPEQFEQEETYASAGNYKGSQFDIRTGKRLYRDPDTKILAGVCSGLSAYLGIEDPIWMRLAFAVAFFGFGIGVIPYIILWMVVPEAKTSGDKLAMRGEAANVSNIASFVQENMQHIGKKITEFSKEFK